MPKVANEAATDITQEEWEALETGFCSSSFLPVIQRLRASGNTPEAARSVLGEGSAYSGDDRVNGVLRKIDSPFKMGRIDVWHEGQDRTARLLALVRR